MAEKPLKARVIAQDFDKITIEIPNSEQSCHRFFNAYIRCNNKLELTIIALTKATIWPDSLIITISGPRPNVNIICESINKVW